MDRNEAAKLLHIPLTRAPDAVLDTLADEREAENRRTMERSHDIRRQYHFLMELLPKEGRAWQRRRDILRIAVNNQGVGQKDLAGLLNESESTISKDVSILRSLIEEIDEYYVDLRKMLPDTQHQKVLVDLINQQIDSNKYEEQSDMYLLKSQIKMIKKYFLNIINNKRKGKKEFPKEGEEHVA